ncbi:D-alanyl-D-alanine carboxypeptidase family protein [Sporichthya polymorpha]|uniref:D-alanyl-D-alanine carboxypeptidase family protein n=1 Tax=Sporichthya polymorpha TaxID=35751 RepID=UPI00037C61B2|nr:D-alanyl-D-alanine carboxypeptidase [Sporichthya polymorpha]
MRSRRGRLGVAGLGLVLAALLPATVPSTAAADTGSVIGGPRMAEQGFVVPSGATALPNISSAAWVVADADTGQVLAARDPHRKLRPASTLKTLLALTMAPRLNNTDLYVADWEDANQEGTRIGLWPGHTYKVGDLWYALMLKSGNDAATALAKAGAGSLQQGIAMMQAEARRLQANDTTVVNPSGLDADGQFSSAYDLALWGRAALQRGDLRRYMTTVRHSFNAVSVPADSKYKDEAMYARTENRLVQNEYPGAIGVKMGYTTKAQNTMIAAAERDGRRIVASLMFTPQGRITPDAAALLEWGFANSGRVEPVGQLVEPLSKAVVSEADLAPVVGVSTNDIRPTSVANASDSDDLLVGGFSAKTSAMTGGLLAVAAALGVLALKVAKRRRRFAAAGVYRY